LSNLATALREIRRLQKSVDLQIPKTPFMRFVREISHGMMDGLRFQSKAMAAIQEEAENLLVREFESIPPCELQITM
jgi:histone H3